MVWQRVCVEAAEEEGCPCHLELLLFVDALGGKLKGWRWR